MLRCTSARRAGGGLFRVRKAGQRGKLLRRPGKEDVSDLVEQMEVENRGMEDAIKKERDRHE